MYLCTLVNIQAYARVYTYMYTHTCICTYTFGPETKLESECVASHKEACFFLQIHRSYLPSELSAWIYHPGTRAPTSCNRHCGIIVRQRHMSPESSYTTWHNATRVKAFCPCISQLALLPPCSALRDPPCQHLPCIVPASLLFFPFRCS